MVKVNAVPFLMKVVALDADLLLMRKEVLARYPLKYYRANRKRNAIPRAHWWYLHEEEEDKETKAAGKRAAGAKHTR